MRHRLRVLLLCLPVVLPSRLLAEQPRLEDFYKPNQVQTVHMKIKDTDWQRMMDALPKRIYVPASFRWRDVAFEKVAVRFKGNSSSNPSQPFKRSFLVRFDKYEQNARFLGLKRVSFDNGIQFGSLFSEPIVTEILRAEGVKVHRANYAKLQINGEYRGVYVNVERIDEVFLGRHWPGSGGPLYKIDEGGPGCNFQLISEDPAAYKRAFERKNDAAKNEAARLVNLIRMINQAPAEGFADRLASQWETDRFLKVTAVLLFSGAFDQLTGWNAHNYYLYHDQKTDCWNYLPWDLDVGFSEVAFGRIRVLDDWHAAWPVPRTGSQNPLMERVVTDPALLRAYRETAARILEKHFKPEHLEKILDAKYELIREDLKTDPFPHRRVTSPTDRSYNDIVTSIRTFIRRRYDSAKSQLMNPGPRPKREPLRPQGRGPQPGPTSKDAPTMLEVVSVDGSTVKLKWNDNADGEAGTILQRAVGEKGTFQNLIGQPGGSITTATDHSPKPNGTFRYRVYSIHPTPNGPKGTGVSNVVTVTIGNASVSR